MSKKTKMISNKIPTNHNDDNGNPIFVGDTLLSEWNYYVTVCEDKEDKHYPFYGKLVCKPTHSCANIPYALNQGEGHTIVNPNNLNQDFIH